MSGCCSSWQVAAPAAEFQTHFLSECFAALEGAKEFIENADHNRVDANILGLGPLEERCFCIRSDVEELGPGQFQTGFTGLPNVYRFLVNMF